MHIDHINIKAPPDLLDEVREFYCQVLGLEEGFRPEFSNAGHWLYGDGRPVVHLSRGSGPRAEYGSSYLDHVAFRTEEGEAVCARLESRGIPYRRDYVAELDLSQLFFRDPAGNGLEVNFPGGSGA